MKRPFILYVDDDYSFLNIFTLSFRNIFDIVTAEDGEEALEQLKKYKNKVDLIIADYDMPNMNGLDFLKIIKQEHPFIPFILYTGLGSEQVARDAFTSGAFDYYIKDITGFTFKEKLANSVKQAIEKARNERLYAGQQEEIKLFRKMTDTASHGIIMFDNHRKPLYFNQAFADIHNYSMDELVDETLLKICREIMPDGFIDDNLKEFRTQTYETTIRKKDGRQIPAAASFQELKENDETIIGYTCTLMDLACRTSTDHRIRHLNKVLLAIRNVNQLIVQEKDRKKLIDKTCYFMTESRGYNAAWIVITDPQGKIKTSSLSGQILGYEDFLDTINNGQRPECLTCADNSPQKTILSDPVTLYGDCPMFTKLNPGKKMITTITHGENRYGYIGVIVPEDIGIDETETSLFSEVAGDIAYALYNLDMEEKKLTAECEVEIKEKRYRELFHQMLNGFAHHEIITDENGNPIDYRFLEINPAFEQITGLKVESTTGKTVKEVIPEIDNIWIERYGKVALTGEPIQFDDYFEPFDKYYRILAYSPERNYFAVIFNDITETKKAEIELAKKVDLLQRVFDTSPIGINLVDNTGRIVYANKEIEKTTEVDYDTSTKRDYNSQEWVITDINDDMLPDEKLPFFIVRSTLQPVYNQLLCIHTPNGERRIINVNGAPLFTSDNVFDGAVILINNITQQENNARLLKERNSQLSAIFNAIPDLFLNIDVNGKITECLSKTPELQEFGVSGNIKDQYLWEIIQGISQEAVLVNINDCLTSCNTINIETSFEAGGKTRYLEIRIVPVTTDQLICVIRNITITKTLQNEIIQKNRELENFAQVLGHEMKNPINIIANYLISMEEDPEVFKEYSGRVQRICGQLNLFVNNLLKLSRAGKVIGDKNPLKIGRIINSTLKTFAVMDKDIKIELISSIEEESQIYGDMESIRHVIANIIENSINHRDPDKDVLQIKTGAKVEKDRTIFFIQDNGLGMEEFSENIFNLRLAHKKDKGTGFGLAISKKIMEAHGGRIYAQSPGKNQGFTVFLEFPSSSEYLPG